MRRAERPFRVLTAAAFCTLCAIALPASAAEWDVKQLMGELAKVQHAKSAFVEKKYLKVLTKPLEQSGVLEYQAPDKLEKRTLQPKPEAMLVHGDTVTLESARGRRTINIQDNAVVWGFVESIRGTLNGDLKTLERFYRVQLSGDPSFWKLVLLPKDAKMSKVVERISIGGGNGKVKTIEIREAQGDRSVMTVLEVRP